MVPTFLTSNPSSSQNTYQHLPTANKLKEHIATKKKQIFVNHLAFLHVPFNFTNSCYINSARPILINQRILGGLLPYQHSFDSSEPKISFLWLNSCTIANGHYTHGGMTQKVYMVYVSIFQLQFYNILPYTLPQT